MSKSSGAAEIDEWDLPSEGFIDSSQRFTSEEKEKIKEIASKVGEENPEDLLQKLSALSIQFNALKVQDVVLHFIGIGMKRENVESAADILKMLPEKISPAFNQIMAKSYKEIVKLNLASQVSSNARSDVRCVVNITAKLCELDFFDKPDIIAMVKFNVDKRRIDEKNLRNLLTFVEVFKTLFEPKKLSKNSQMQVAGIGEILKSRMKNKPSGSEFTDFGSKILKVLGFVHIGSNVNLPDSFQSMISALHQRKDVDMDFSFGHIETTSKYYFENAIKSEADALTFAHFLKKIFDLGLDNDNEFLNLVVDEAKHIYMQQHQGFPISDQRAIGSAHFMANLVVHTGFVDKEILNEAIYVSKKQVTAVSEQCIEIFKEAYEICSEKESEDQLDKPKKKNKIKIILEDSSKAFQNLLDNMTVEDGTSLQKISMNNRETVLTSLNMLFQKGLSSPELAQTIIKICVAVVENSETDFKMKSLRKMFEGKIAQEFQEFLEDKGPGHLTKLLTFAYQLIDDSLITKAGILNIWKTLSECVDLNADIGLPIMVNFIYKTQKSFEHLEGKKSIALVTSIKKKLTLHFDEIVDKSDPYKSVFIDVLKYLEKALCSSPAQQVKESKHDETLVLHTNPIEEFKVFMETKSADITKLREIISQLDALDKEVIRKLAKIFAETTKDRNDVGRLAVIINYLLKIYGKTEEETSFKEILTHTTQNSFKKLPKFHSIEEKNMNRASVLVQMSGELYNIGWLEQSKLIGCMDKLSLNEFGSKFQLETFHLLLNIVKDEMMRKNHIGKTKYYIDILDNNPNQDSTSCVLILNEILEASKKAQKLEHEHRLNEKLKCLDMYFEALTTENVTDVARKIASLMSTKKVEQDLSPMVRELIARANDDPRFFTKVTKEINKTFLINNVLLHNCQEQLLEQTQDGKNDPRIIGLSHLIGELYNNNLATEEYVKLSLDLLFGYETSSPIAVDCICVVFKTVGAKMENFCPEKLDHFFKYFQFVVSQAEKSHKTIMFTFLIDLRKKEWICHDDDAKTMIEYFLSSMCKDNVQSLAIRVTHFIGGCEVIANALIKNTVEMAIFQPDAMELCGYFLRAIISKVQHYESKILNNLLMNFLKQQHSVFLTVPTENYSDLRKLLGRKTTFVTQLNRLEVVSDDFMAFWLNDKVIEILTIEDAAHLSDQFKDVLYESENVNLKLQLLTLEEKISNEIQFLTCCMKDDFEELLSANV